MNRNHLLSRELINHTINELSNLTPPDIAYYLHIRGIKGKRLDSLGYVCPINKLFRSYYGFDPSVILSVERDHVFIDDGGKETIIMFPAAITAFIVAFDNGLYPQLEEN